MPRTGMLLLAGAAFAAAAGLNAGTNSPVQSELMPVPSEWHPEPGVLPISAGFAVNVTGCRDPRLASAVSRLMDRWAIRTGIGFARPSAPGAGAALVVECRGAGGPVPALGDDESYCLRVSPNRAVLSAATVVGALRGLETVAQLLTRDPSGFHLPACVVSDRPRFPWRGLLIDVARHWQPPEVIERTLDGMAMVKLNVLHLHLTDDQGFRIESLTHPELQAKGSDGLYFTQARMREIIAYATARGIRVVPEFDLPGHATSWAVSHPELASLPGPYSIERHWGVFNPVLDPTNEALYSLLDHFLGEMAALFPDAYVHIGGDENNGVQWNSSPRIQAFIREHGLKDNGGLHAYFNGRIAAILAKHGKRLVGWDEILHAGLPPSCVIDSWRGSDALAEAAVLGHDGILSNGFYIDLIRHASEHYLVDPIPASCALTPAQRAHILGGEATMWSEWVSPETIDSRIWPRTAAIAERLWSPAGVRDVGDMYRRLAFVSARLGEAGALHERGRDTMLRHLVGENLGAPGVAALRTFINLVEPVKDYRRGVLQVWMNQLVPLVGVADAARPESTLSHEFAESVDRLLFAGGGIDRPLAGPVADRLREWGEDGRQVADTLAADYPALREAIPTGRDLVDACAVGASAVASLASGRPIPGATLAKGLAALDRDGEPNGSATELPILPSIRMLVAAAALQGERPRLSDQEWRERVVAAAALGSEAGGR